MDELKKKDAEEYLKTAELKEFKTTKERKKTLKSIVKKWKEVDIAQKSFRESKFKKIVDIIFKRCNVQKIELQKKVEFYRRDYSATKTIEEREKRIEKLNLAAIEEREAIERRENIAKRLTKIKMTRGEMRKFFEEEKTKEIEEGEENKEIEEGEENKEIEEGEENKEIEEQRRKIEEIKE